MKVQSNISKSLKTSGTVLCTIFLTACNGGSDSSGSSTKKFVTNATAKINCSDVDKETILAAINKARSQTHTCNGITYKPSGALVWNNFLEKVASNHADDLIKNDIFTHDSSDGTKYQQRMANYGQPGVFGEIIATHPDINGAINGWLGSPTHCVHLLNPDYKSTGLVCKTSTGTKYDNYWVQEFNTEK